MKKKSGFLTITNTVILVIITLVVLFPIFLAVSTSLKPANEITSTNPGLIPHDFTLKNYQALFARGNYGTYMFNSILVSGLTALLCIIIASIAAYAIVWMRLPAKKAIVRSLFVSYMFPAIISAIPLFMICYEMGLIDNRFILVLIYLSFDLPFGIWLMKSSLESIPSGLIEAAKLDGCSDIHVLGKVVVPLSLPFMMTAGALSFVLSWNDYLVASVLITNDSNRTLALGLHSLVGYYHADYGLITAAGVVMLIPVLILFLLVHKYLVKGISF